MPKIVDHGERREQLVEATWRIIARNGLPGATMRQIAAEAGFANGALKPYFATKAALIEATYFHVFERTNRRVGVAARGLRGLAALEAFGREVLPLDEERLDEARVVISFWQQAAHDRHAAELNNLSMDEWRRALTGWLEQARESGDLGTRVEIPATADALLNFMLGTQITAVLDPSGMTSAVLTGQLGSQLDRLRACA
ncbi:TetR/AcrR family transcriptional regulator [Brachybacterium vulturis]|uniref:TetR/AcrR family transcriptional regulator n=1 Tax=Brachybacterium vulturis TaxID=2017484 RepID=UPI00373576AB